MTNAPHNLIIGQVFKDGRSVAAIDETGRVAIAPAPADAGRVFGNRNREPAARWYAPDSKTLAAIVKRNA